MNSHHDSISIAFRSQGHLVNRGAFEQRLARSKFPTLDISSEFSTTSETIPPETHHQRPDSDLHQTPCKENTLFQNMSSRPSQLAISTSSVQRLLKEESTYRAELTSQESRLRKLEQETSDEDGNREWSVRQEVCSIRLLF